MSEQPPEEQPPEEQPPEPVSSGQLRRLHPLTPFVRGWKLIAVLVAAAGQDALRNLDLAQLLLTAAVVLPLALAYGFLAWRFTRFRIEGDDLRLETGVLFRRTRHVRLGRLQAVDVVRPLLARFAGLAELRLEVAGGNQAEAPLAYLSESEARRLRAELLARAAGVAPQTREAPERVLVRVPIAALVTSIALSLLAVATFLLGLLLVGVVVVSGELEVMFVTVPVVLAVASAGFNRFAANFDFTLATSPDGLRLRHGLLEHRSRTVPPGRIQSIRIVQPLLWRRYGWVRVQVNVAGYAGQRDSDQAAGGDLLPVAPREVAMAVIGWVLPGVDVDGVPLVAAPRRAAWLRPVTWRGLACGAGETVFVSRRGVLRRELEVIPYEKIQSVRLLQGPLQARLRLASLHLDTTPGPVHVDAVHRDAAESGALVEEAAARSRSARRLAGPERWMTQGGTGNPAGETGEGAP